MPLIRLDEETKKEQPVSIEVEAKKNVQKKEIKKKNGKKNYYPLFYVMIAVGFFGLALLIIALINLAIGNGFTI